MIFRGTVLGFNSFTNIATVEVNGNTIQSENYLGNSIDPSKETANSFLPTSMYYTVLPSKILKTGDYVTLTDMNGTTSPVILGIVSLPETTTTQPVNVFLKPGYFEIIENISTPVNGSYTLNNFAEKALVHRIKITSALALPFIVKFYNMANELQASWGDGDIEIENGILEDAAGFFFVNDLGNSAKLEITPSGNYHLELAGWRFI